MNDELAALERINIILNGGIPDRVSSLCLGSDFRWEKYQNKIWNIF
jgi:hypothetical protein